MTPSEILYKAAEYIGEHGHHKGTYAGPNGSVCALGAIGETCFTDSIGVWESHNPRLIACNALSLHVGYTVDSWNDLPSTSAEDVILAMKTVAAQLEEKLNV